MQDRDEVNREHQRSDKVLSEELTTLGKKVSCISPVICVSRRTPRPGGSELID